jgi:plastocyanin
MVCGAVSLRTRRSARLCCPAMTPTRLAFPLAVLLSLVLATPASAAFDWKTDVVNFKFEPNTSPINVGDTVTWSFVADGHTSASLPGQPDHWRSAASGANAAGSTYTHTFNTPGKYQYICLQHSFMKGTIEVGTDTVVKSISKFRTKRRGHQVKLSFKLNEPAKVTYKLSGPSRRTVKKGRLTTGTHSFTLKRLKKGTYRGKLTVVDDFDKKTTPRDSFTIR